MSMLGHINLKLFIKDCCRTSTRNTKRKPIYASNQRLFCHITGIYEVID